MAIYITWPAVPISSVGLATSALQTTGNASLTSIDGKVPANLTVTATRLLVDPSGVTQPVSAASLPLPTGASTEATLSTLNTKVPANLTVTATRLLVDPSGVTQPVSAASLPLPTGAATETTLSAVNTKLPSNLTVTATRLLVDGSGVTQPVSGTVAATQSGTWTVQPGNTANTTPWLVAEERVSTSAVTSVSASASSVSLLASTAGRKNATFFNDSASVVYLKLGATASTTSYTTQIQPYGYYELPQGRTYTGAVDAIWTTATGSMRITELS